MWFTMTGDKRSGLQPPWSQVWQDSSEATRQTRAVNRVNLICVFWISDFGLYWPWQRMLEKVCFRKATLEDWDHVEMVSQVCYPKTSALPSPEISGRVWGARLPAKCLQHVDYWRGDRKAFQVALFPNSLSSLKRHPVPGSILWQSWMEMLLVFSLCSSPGGEAPHI